MVSIDKQKLGKRSRASGQRFELSVRKDLESKGWITIKNPNNVINGKFAQGKNKYNPFTKRILAFGGFPDFICFGRKVISSSAFLEIQKLKEQVEEMMLYNVIGVECKVGKYLDTEEKKKVKWLKDNNIFSKILVAYRGKKRGEICYKDL